MNYLIDLQFYGLCGYEEVTNDFEPVPDGFVVIADVGVTSSSV